jgi:uncharacterized protein YbjQ (UPF0145 family)
MADDYGDDSGQKILDDLTRFAERMGAAAMIRRADGLHAALEHAKATTHQEKTKDGAEPVEYAKLDMHEFRALDDYDGIKKIIEAKLGAHGVDTAWFADEQLGKEYLLFHVSDAQEVWQGLDELSRETEAAKAKALERLGREAERVRDERPLEERAKEARKASEALESERGHTRVRERPAPDREKGTR